jgi:hypothetical protein
LTRVFEDVNPHCSLARDATMRFIFFHQNFSLRAVVPLLIDGDLSIDSMEIIPNSCERA